MWIELIENDLFLKLFSVIKQQTKLQRKVIVVKTLKLNKSNWKFAMVEQSLTLLETKSYFLLNCICINFFTVIENTNKISTLVSFYIKKCF